MTRLRREPWPETGRAETAMGGLRQARFDLLASGVALAVGLTATVAADGARWFGVRGPYCPLGTLVHPRACPGCGLLRSTAAALQGEPGTAFHAHPAGPVLAVLFVAAFLLGLDVLRRGRALPWQRTARRLGGRVFVASILLGWLWRIAFA